MTHDSAPTTIEASLPPGYLIGDQERYQRLVGGLPALADLFNCDFEIGNPAIADEGLKHCGISLVEQLGELVNFGVGPRPLPLYERKRVRVAIPNHRVCQAPGARRGLGPAGVHPSRLRAPLVAKSSFVTIRCQLY